MRGTNDNKDPLEFYKMEYKICRSKIDDIDKLLKDIRFQGISIITGFTGAVGFLFSFDYWNISFLLSIFTIILIALIWGYDHKFFIFLNIVATRAIVLEKKFGKYYDIKAEGMLSHAISRKYPDLALHSTHTASIMYSLFIIILDILLISSSYNFPNNIFYLYFSHGIIILTAIYIFWMWILRFKVKNPSEEAKRILELMKK